MSLMLDHVDSPYIRCVGFLYLRYAADPATLWSWFEPYLHAEEQVQIRQGKADTTVGKYVTSLLSELDYHGTRLPRLPLAIERQFKVKLLQAERVEERALKHLQNKAAMDYFQKVGARIQALYGDDENPITWYDAVVDRVIMRNQETGEMLSRPKFQVIFPEYGNTEVVTLGEVDLPGSNDSKRSAVEREGRSEGYGRKSERDYPGDDSGRGRGRDDRNRRGYDDYRGDRYDPRERDVHARGYHDGRNRAHVGHGPDDRYSSRDSENRRDRSRSRDRGDNLNDARREEQELMEEVLRRERDKTAAKGRAYAARPATFKSSLGSPGMHSRHHAEGSDWKPRASEGKPKAERTDANDSKPAAAPVVQKTAAELSAIEDKKRKLMARYG